MLIPTLRTLCQQLPGTIVDVLARHKASKDILERVNSSGNIYIFNPGHSKSFTQKAQFLRMLRKRQYDVSMTTFPSNRAEFHLLSYFIGAKRRIAHRYKRGYFQTLGFLQTEFVEVDVHHHEIDQNLALLSPLKINAISAKKDTCFSLEEAEVRYAEEFLKKHHLSPQDILIGFHPGCNPAQGNIYRRWPAEHFAKLGDKLAETFRAKILVGFGGQEENQLNEKIYQLMIHKPIIPENTSIVKTAALIKKCWLFVAGGSGIMHLAAAMNVPAVALFGPIDPVRCAPDGEGHLVIQADLPCVPCNTYPHDQFGGSHIRCIYEGDRQGYCMQHISVERVYEAIVRNYTALLKPEDR